MISLSSIDKYLREISEKQGASFTWDETKGMWLPHGYEERSLRWSKEGFNYLIQIFPTIDNNQITGWNFGQVVSADINGIRYWKQEKPIENSHKEEIIDKIEDLVPKAIAWLSKQAIKDLEPVVKLHTT